MNTPRAPRRGSGDEGAVLVEFALVAPFLLLLLFGLIDYGRLTNDDNVLIRSVQSAARTGASQGTDRFADYNVLESLEASLVGLEGSEIERVVVYRASTADGKVPSACVSAPISNDLSPKGLVGARCNIYSRAQVESRANTLGVFPAAPCTGGWDAAWCPSSRSRGTETTDPDFLGVYVRIKSSSLTGVVAPTLTDLTSESVFRLDPCVTGVSCA